MNKKAFEDGWRGFLELCAKIENPEAFQNLFALFMTFEERENIASRYLIVKTLLEEQMTQREMSEKYQVSIAQITRGSNALKIITPELKKKIVKADQEIVMKLKHLFNKTNPKLSQSLSLSFSFFFWWA